MIHSTKRTIVGNFGSGKDQIIRIRAVEVAEASEVAEADEVNETAEVLRPGISLLRTSESSMSLNSALF